MLNVNQCKLAKLDVFFFWFKWEGSFIFFIAVWLVSCVGHHHTMVILAKINIELPSDNVDQQTQQTHHCLFESKSKHCHVLAFTGQVQLTFVHRWTNQNRQKSNYFTIVSGKKTYFLKNWLFLPALNLNTNLVDFIIPLFDRWISLFRHTTFVQ